MLKPKREIKMIKANTSMVRKGTVIGANTEGIPARAVAKAWCKAGRPAIAYVSCGYGRDMKKTKAYPSTDGTSRTVK